MAFVSMFNKYNFNANRMLLPCSLGVEKRKGDRYVTKIIEIITSVDLEMLIRLLIAALLGLVLGVERELKRKSLGLRTILVISIASCLLTIVSIQSSYLLPASTNAEIRMDPLRLAAQVISGVGFLGAGVILRRDDDTISGLTTAAIVWGAAGIGIATGAGFYVEAIVGVALILISVETLPIIVNKLDVRRLNVTEQYLRVKVNNREDIETVLNEIKKRVVEVRKIRIKDINENEHLIVMLLITSDQSTMMDIYNDLAEVQGIKGIEIRV